MTMTHEDYRQIHDPDGQFGYKELCDQLSAEWHEEFYAEHTGGGCMALVGYLRIEGLKDPLQVMIGDAEGPISSAHERREFEQTAEEVTKDWPRPRTTLGFQVAVSEIPEWADWYEGGLGGAVSLDATEADVPEMVRAAMDDWRRHRAAGHLACCCWYGMDQAVWGEREVEETARIKAYQAQRKEQGYW